MPLHTTRTHYLDPDLRRQPKTNRFCAVCQRDLKGEGSVIWLAEGCHHAVHPLDIDGTEVAALIGPECATVLPSGFRLSGQMAPLIRARHRWNAQADEFNQWPSLGEDEKIALVEAEPCRAGDIRIFRKSGNPVQLIANEGGHWQVIRTHGRSTGKNMLCPDHALLWSSPGQETETLDYFDWWLAQPGTVQKPRLSTSATC